MTLVSKYRMVLPVRQVGSSSCVPRRSCEVCRARCSPGQYLLLAGLATARAPRTGGALVRGCLPSAGTPGYLRGCRDLARRARPLGREPPEGGAPSATTPIDPSPVNLDDGLADALLSAVVVDGLPARRQRVVVDDQEAARRELRVERLERDPWSTRTGRRRGAAPPAARSARPAACRGTSRAGSGPGRRAGRSGRSSP